MARIFKLRHFGHRGGVGGPAQEVQTSVDFRSRGDELRVAYAVFHEKAFSINKFKSLRY